MKKILVNMFLLVFTLCLVGCDLSWQNNPPVISKRYEFHYYVDDGNGTIEIDNLNHEEFSNPSLCQDSLTCTHDGADKSYVVSVTTGKEEEKSLQFIATPNEGYQVKEWLFNGEVVEGNKTNSYTAIVSSNENYIGLIAVRFEEIQCEHQWDEGVEVESGTDMYVLEFTCEKCGAKDRQTITLPPYHFSVTVTGDIQYLKNYIHDIYRPDSNITIETQILIDADIEVYVNGEKIERDTNNNSIDSWFYEFIMPEEDVVVEIRVVTIKYLEYLGQIYEWAADLKIEDIQEVRYERAAIGVAPGSLKYIEYSKDSKDIQNTFNILSAPISVCNEDEDKVTGGGYSRYDFITKTGECYNFEIRNGHIYDYLINEELNMDVYEKQKPSEVLITLYDFLGEYYQFANPYLNCSSFIMDYNPYPVYDCDTDTVVTECDNLFAIEFIPCEVNLSELTSAMFYIKSMFGDIYILDDNKFYFKDENTYTFYQIVGNNSFSFNTEIDSVME